MVNNWLARRMGISQLDGEAQSITLRYLIVDSLRTLTNAFVQIFILLYIIDELGFKEAGIVLGINLIATRSVEQ